ncbi:DinB family protein [candidate division KSB1 bacterium]|nr:MAG: DinB family protein [candidate division KSB1 bacterium]MCE7943257.1 DinB family protein [Chlorobi bacterium CHB1]
MFSTGAPQTRSEIIASLQRLYDESQQFLVTLTDAEFFMPQGEKWSPAEQVRHLTKSVWPVAQALRLPRIALALLFGCRRTASRSFTEVETFYQDKLKTGVTAGRFAPSPQSAPEDPRARRTEIMQYWHDAHRKLVQAIAAWPEAALDHYRLPHPALGKLTLREMFFFTLYHNAHHVRQIHARRTH